MNLAAELEIRLTGRSLTRGLRPDLAEFIPHTRNYLLLIIDGLGDQQLAHPAASTLHRHRRTALCAPFPTTTSVGLSSVATALAPIQMACRGAERHGYSSLSDIRPSDLFDTSSRTLAVVYTTAVDTAAHAYGQRSQEYTTALSETGRTWEHFRRSLPPDTTLIGSADHGHCDIPPDGRSTWTRTSPTVCNAGETAAYSCSPDPPNGYTGSPTGPMPGSSAPKNSTDG